VDIAPMGAVISWVGPPTPRSGTVSSRQQKKKNNPQKKGGRTDRRRKACFPSRFRQRQVWPHPDDGFTFLGPIVGSAARALHVRLSDYCNRSHRRPVGREPWVQPGRGPPIENLLAVITNGGGKTTPCRSSGRPDLPVLIRPGEAILGRWALDPGPAIDEENCCRLGCRAVPGGAGDAIAIDRTVGPLGPGPPVISPKSTTDPSFCFSVPGPREIRLRFRPLPIRRDLLDAKTYPPLFLLRMGGA